jgi:hypothetical protein
VRLPWPFGRSTHAGGASPDPAAGAAYPAGAGPDAADDGGTGSGDAAARVPPTGAWRTLPPIQRAAGPPPVVAPSAPFLAGVPGHLPLPPIVTPLGHESSPAAPAGIVVAHPHAVPSLTSSAPLPRRPVQRRAPAAAVADRSSTGTEPATSRTPLRRRRGRPGAGRADPAPGAGGACRDRHARGPPLTWAAPALTPVAVARKAAPAAAVAPPRRPVQRASAPGGARSPGRRSPAAPAAPGTGCSRHVGARAAGPAAVRGAADRPGVHARPRATRPPHGGRVWARPDVAARERRRPAPAHCPGVRSPPRLGGRRRGLARACRRGPRDPRRAGGADPRQRHDLPLGPRPPDRCPCCRSPGSGASLLWPRRPTAGDNRGDAARGRRPRLVRDAGRTAPAGATRSRPAETPPEAAPTCPAPLVLPRSAPGRCARRSRSRRPRSARGGRRVRRLVRWRGRTAGRARRRPLGGGRRPAGDRDLPAGRGPRARRHPGPARPRRRRRPAGRRSRARRSGRRAGARHARDRVPVPGRACRIHGVAGGGPAGSPARPRSGAAPARRARRRRPRGRHPVGVAGRTGSAAQPRALGRAAAPAPSIASAAPGPSSGGSSPTPCALRRRSCRLAGGRRHPRGHDHRHAGRPASRARRRGRGHGRRRPVRLELDDLARQLFGRIRGHLRAEVIHERELAGLTFDAF